MAIHRVIAAGCTERQILVRVLAALRDPDVEAVTIQKAGSQLLDTTGRECIVGPDGSLIPLRVPRTRAEDLARWEPVSC